MKARLRKKYWTLQCKHLVDGQIWLTDDPYPFYTREIYCRLNPEKEFPDDFHTAMNNEICSKCKNFCPSKSLIKESNKWEREQRKEDQRYFQKHPQEFREAKEHNFRLDKNNCDILDLL